MQEIKLPNLGEGIKSGTVVRVLVAQGDKVRAQQTLIELETDKALIEVPCDVAGTISEVKVSEGDTLAVGHVILTLEPEQSADTAAPPPPPAAPPQPAEAAQPKAPGQPAELAPSAAPAPPVPVAAPAAPVQPAPSATAAASPLPQAVPDTVVEPYQVAPAAGPTTRRLARELGVELSQVQGSGRGGRVTREDVLAHVQQVMQRSTAAGSAVPAIALPDFSQWGAIETESLSAVRRKTAEHLAQVWPAVPLVTQFDDADITELEAMRKRFKPEAEVRGLHLTLTVLLLKALVTGLKEQPRFNSSLDLARDQLVLKRYYNFGIATETPRGLLVPVLRDVDVKDIWQLCAELQVLTERTRAGQVELNDLRGASFTLSNQGGIGGTHFTPLVNLPEVAILGVGQARRQPLWDDASEQFQPRLVLPLALSYDHRVLDGADAARFVAGLKRRLEDPQRLLLGI